MNSTRDDKQEKLNQLSHFFSQYDPLGLDRNVDLDTFLPELAKAISIAQSLNMTDDLLAEQFLKYIFSLSTMCFTSDTYEPENITIFLKAAIQNCFSAAFELASEHLRLIHLQKITNSYGHMLEINDHYQIRIKTLFENSQLITSVFVESPPSKRFIQTLLLMNIPINQIPIPSEELSEYQKDLQDSIDFLCHLANSRYGNLLQIVDENNQSNKISLKVMEGEITFFKVLKAVRTNRAIIINLSGDIFYVNKKTHEYRLVEIAPEKKDEFHRRFPLLTYKPSRRTKLIHLLNSYEIKLLNYILNLSLLDMNNKTEDEKIENLIINFVRSFNYTYNFHFSQRKDNPYKVFPRNLLVAKFIEHLGRFQKNNTDSDSYLDLSWNSRYSVDPSKVIKLILFLKNRGLIYTEKVTTTLARLANNEHQRVFINKLILSVEILEDGIGDWVHTLLTAKIIKAAHPKIDITLVGFIDTTRKAIAGKIAYDILGASFSTHLLNNNSPTDIHIQVQANIDIFKQADALIEISHAAPGLLDFCKADGVVFSYYAYWSEASVLLHNPLLVKFSLANELKDFSARKLRIGLELGIRFEENIPDIEKEISTKSYLESLTLLKDKELTVKLQENIFNGITYNSSLCMGYFRAVADLMIFCKILSDFHKDKNDLINIYVKRIPTPAEIYKACVMYNIDGNIFTLSPSPPNRQKPQPIIRLLSQPLCYSDTSVIVAMSELTGCGGDNSYFQALSASHLPFMFKMEHDQTFLPYLLVLLNKEKSYVHLHEYMTKLDNISDHIAMIKSGRRTGVCGPVTLDKMSAVQAMMVNELSKFIMDYKEQILQEYNSFTTYLRLHHNFKKNIINMGSWYQIDNFLGKPINEQKVELISDKRALTVFFTPAGAPKEDTDTRNDFTIYLLSNTEEDTLAAVQLEVATHDTKNAIVLFPDTSNDSSSSSSNGSRRYKASYLYDGNWREDNVNKRAEISIGNYNFSDITMPLQRNSHIYLISSTRPNYKNLLKEALTLAGIKKIDSTISYQRSRPG